MFERPKIEEDADPAEFFGEVYTGERGETFRRYDEAINVIKPFLPTLDPDLSVEVAEVLSKSQGKMLPRLIFSHRTNPKIGWRLSLERECSPELLRQMVAHDYNARKNRT